ncbi:MAG: MYXO-CTERM sorting domain-containing protein [Archangium sp.]|nr:MYXO-CTERM sorting domain-containing protein [Archangium sp.]
MRNVWLGLTVVAIGCGVSVENFPSGAAKAYCKQVYTCCSAGETADAGSLGPDQPTCATNVTTQLDGKTGLIKSEQSKGRLTYKGDVAQACIDKLAALKCQELKSTATATPAECTTYTEPKTALGAACQLSESCIGSWCSGATLSADGTCTAFIAEGQSCSAGQCIAGTYCDGSSTCAKPKADGAACNGNFECATGGCNNKGADGGTGTCGLRGGSGTTCFVTQGCSATGPGIFALLALVLLARKRR